MLKLNNLSSGGKDRKRVGRGGSRGGTSGKGHKGQKARSGGAVGPVKEGGQMPLVRRIPKRGFNNTRFQKSFSIINLDRLNELFNDGDVVTRELLIEKGEMHRKDMLKILGNGALTKKLTVHADAFSESAQEAIKSKGGQVHLTQEL